MSRRQNPPFTRSKKRPETAEGRAAIAIVREVVRIVIKDPLEEYVRAVTANRHARGHKRRPA